MPNNYSLAVTLESISDDKKETGLMEQLSLAKQVTIINNGPIERPNDKILKSIFSPNNEEIDETDEMDEGSNIGAIPTVCAHSNKILSIKKDRT